MQVWSEIENMIYFDILFVLKVSSSWFKRRNILWLPPLHVKLQTLISSYLYIMVWHVKLTILTFVQAMYGALQMSFVRWFKVFGRKKPCVHFVKYVQSFIWSYNFFIHWRWQNAIFIDPGWYNPIGNAKPYWSLKLAGQMYWVRLAYYRPNSKDAIVSIIVNKQLRHSKCVGLWHFSKLLCACSVSYS